MRIMPWQCRIISLHEAVVRLPEIIALGKFTVASETIDARVPAGGIAQQLLHMITLNDCPQLDKAKWQQVHQAKARLHAMAWT